MKCSFSGDNAVKKKLYNVDCQVVQVFIQPDNNLTNNPVSNVCQVKIKMFIHMPHSVSVI